jgi:hypothetical protein
VFGCIAAVTVEDVGVASWKSMLSAGQRVEVCSQSSMLSKARQDENVRDERVDGVGIPRLEYMLHTAHTVALRTERTTLTTVLVLSLHTRFCGRCDHKAGEEAVHAHNTKTNRGLCIRLNQSNEERNEE